RLRPPAAGLGHRPAVPRQGVAVPPAGAGRAAARRPADPGAPRHHPQRRRPHRRPRRAGPRGAAHDLPRGHLHPGSGAVADAGPPRRGPARPGDGSAAAADRDLGRPRPVARRLALAATPPRAARADAGGGAVHRRGPPGRDHPAGGAARHRGAHGPHRRAARRAAWRAGADRAARRPTGRPPPRGGTPAARLPSLEADLMIDPPAPTHRPAATHPPAPPEAPVPPSRPRLAVLGAGSWGTTFAQVLADSGAEVMLWARREEIAREIRQEHRNSAYLPDLLPPESIRAASRPEEALEGADGVVIAIPAQALRGTLAAWPALPELPVLSLTKGIERGTDARISEVIAAAGGVDPARLGVLSGPNLSAEIAARRPCASVVAAPSQDLADLFAGWCDAPYLRADTSTEVVGVEIAGAVKNVIAIAVGAAAGLGHGHNTTASLMTRGLAEITRLGIALGGRRETFAGLA